MQIGDYLRQYAERNNYTDDRAAALNLLKYAANGLTLIIETKTDMSTDTAVAVTRVLTEMAHVHATLDAAQDPR